MNAPIRLGMTLDEVRAALPGIRIKGHYDEYGLTRRGVFKFEHWDSQVVLTKKIVTAVSGECRVDTIAEALGFVETMVAHGGAPSFAAAGGSRDWFNWTWPVLRFSLLKEPDERWWARWESIVTGDIQWPLIPFDTARETLAGIATNIAAAPAADGGRGLAVQRWRESLEGRRAALDHFLDIVGITTPEHADHRAQPADHRGAGSPARAACHAVSGSRRLARRRRYQ